MFDGNLCAAFYASHGMATAAVLVVRAFKGFPTPSEPLQNRCLHFFLMFTSSFVIHSLSITPETEIPDIPDLGPSKKRKLSAFEKDISVYDTEYDNVKISLPHACFHVWWPMFWWPMFWFIVDALVNSSCPKF